MSQHHTKLLVLEAGGLVVALFFAILFAFNVTNSPEQVPSFALSNDTEVSRPGGDLIREAGGLVAVQTDRGGRSQLRLLFIGLLIWLPTLAALWAFSFAFRLYPALSDDVMWLPIGAALMAILIVSHGVGATIGFFVDTLLIVGGFFAGVAVTRRFGREGNRGLRRHMLILTWLMASAFATSATTHYLFAEYIGFAPATQVPFGELASLYDNLSTRIPPHGVRDEVVWRVALIPGLNQFDLVPTIFLRNIVAVISLIASSIVYLLLFALSIRPRSDNLGRRRNFWWASSRFDKRKQEPVEGEGSNAVSEHQPITKESADKKPHGRRDGRSLSGWERCLFAIVFYIATGIGFAILFFNIYICAAAKQNVLLTYAAYLTVDDDEYRTLLEAFRKHGWRESLEQRILDAAHNRVGRQDLSTTLTAARAQYWPSTIIAQETPAPVVTPDGVARTTMVLSPFVSFHDMIYFSFVSFTTTGYGDIKPVSDWLRFWTVVENITEILFTVVFFTSAMDARGREGQ